MSLHFILLSAIGLQFLWRIWYINKIFGCPSKTCFKTFDLTDFESSWYRFIFSILKLRPFCLIWRYKFMFFSHKRRLWLAYPYFWLFYCLIGKGKTFGGNETRAMRPVFVQQKCSTTETTEKHKTQDVLNYPEFKALCEWANEVFAKCNKKW